MQGFQANAFQNSAFQVEVLVSYAFQAGAFQFGAFQVDGAVVPVQEQPIGYASTYNKREKTRQEQYDEYIKEKTKRNNYLIMMLST